MAHSKLTTNNIINRWLVISVGVFIIVVFNFLEPFGITLMGFRLEYHLLLSTYGVVSSLTVVLILVALYKIYPEHNFSQKQSTLILWLVILIVTVSFSNWLYSQLLHHTISGWRHMYVPTRSFTELMPQLLALYGVWGLICWVNLYFIYQPGKLAKELDVAADDLLTLYSENQSDSFKVRPAQVVCFKTCDNYLQVFYLDENMQLRDRMIRSSMKKMQAQLSSERFYRSHQSFLINLAHVKGLIKNKNNHFLEMAYLGFDVAVSRKNVKQVKSYLTA